MSRDTVALPSLQRVFAAIKLNFGAVGASCWRSEPAGRQGDILDLEEEGR
jgi:hypothetical protein